MVQDSGLGLTGWKLGICSAGMGAMNSIATRERQTGMGASLEAVICAAVEEARTAAARSGVWGCMEVGRRGLALPFHGRGAFRRIPRLLRDLERGSINETSPPPGSPGDGLARLQEPYSGISQR